MRVAALQMNSTPDKARNMSQAFDLLHQAIDKRAELICFPETFTLVSENREQLLEGAESLRGQSVQTLQEWAIEFGVFIAAGSLVIKTRKDAEKVTNTSLMISPDGEIISRYDKIHLFDVEVEEGKPHRESKNVQPGKKPMLAEIGEWKAGLSVCYDLRFPELYRTYSEAGAQILLVPSAFTARTGQAHWDVLTRARAIENQCYVIAAAQTGSPYPGRELWGHTRIVDPWGRVIAERPKGEGVVCADLDFDLVADIRNKLPALENRRL